MEFIVKILQNYDEVVSAGSGVIAGKFLHRGLQKLFPRANGQLGKFLMATGEAVFGMAVFQWGKDNKSSNIKFAGLGVAIEGLSNVVEAITNNSLDGIADNTVNFLFGVQAQTIPAQNFGQISQTQVPVMPDDDEIDDDDESEDEDWYDEDNVVNGQNMLEDSYEDKQDFDLEKDIVDVPYEEVLYEEVF